MGVLTLDLGTKTGFTFGSRSEDAVVISGTWNFNSKIGDARYAQFRKKLIEMHMVDNVDEVHFEEVHRHLGTEAAHVYGGLRAILIGWCHENKVPYFGHEVADIKIVATGHGNAPKDDKAKEKRNAKARAAGRKPYNGLSVVTAVRNWGYEPEDDNEADAIALRRLVLTKPLILQAAE